MDKATQQPSPASVLAGMAPKRPYAAPRLIVHGSLTELTAALGQPGTLVASA